MNNNEIFLDFWKNYQWPKEQPIFYRLYYDSNGFPINYSMEHQPGNYIDITPEQYALADINVKIVNGQIIPNQKKLPPKLVPSEDNGTKCHVHDVTIVDNELLHYQNWKLNTNEN